MEKKDRKRLDQTMVIRGGADGAVAPPEVRVDVEGVADPEPAVFTSDFQIGRGDECAVKVLEAPVSRTHAEVIHRDGDWWIRDLDSSNGTFLNGTRVTEAVLSGQSRVQLGADGPLLRVRVGAGDDSDQAIAEPTTSYYRLRYLEGADDPTAGEHTMMIRKAYAQVSRRRSRRWAALVAVITVLLAVVGGTAVYQHRELERHRALAGQVFYDTKALELQLLALQQPEGGDRDPDRNQALDAGRDRLSDLRGSYERMIDELGVYSEEVPEEQRLIVRIAGVLGECEAVMPPEFVTEVERHIELWQSDTRLEKAIRRAAENGYGKQVANAMVDQHLPPQFFYVALQESDLRTQVCGPSTRYGIAKGPWQFIPSTARAYGLRTGPLYLLREPDPNDERHDFDKATDAAARYLRDLYMKQAQGSGLLAIASYNWGESNVRRLIRRMPENPSERNFWRLFVDHRAAIPDETYGYVFRIFSAAVIGENPRLFGFDFDPPLEPPTSPTTAQ